MELPSIVAVVIAIGGASFAMHLLRHGALGEADYSTVLRYSLRVRVLYAGLGVTFAAILVAVWMKNSSPTTWETLGLIGVCSVIAIGGLTLFRTRVRFDDDEIEGRMAFRRARKMRWDTVQSARVVWWLDGMELEDGSGGRLTIPVLLNGIGYFLTTMERRLDASVRGDVVERVRKRLQA